VEFSSAQLLYLEQMGIDVWIPNVQPEAVSTVQPDMAATNDSAFSAQEKELAASSSAVPFERAPEASPQTQPNHQPNSQPSPGAAPVFPQASSTPPPSERTSSEETPRFHVQFWCYSTGLWVVSGEVDLTPVHHKLVHNLARYLQGAKRKPRHIGIFSWPMLNSPNVDQGPEVAAKYLNDHIQNVASLSPHQKILSFADCAQWFTDQQTIDLPFTLSQAIADPAAKRSIWQQIMGERI